MMWWLKYALFGLWLSAVCTSAASILGDECDWFGSGLTSSSEPGVTPVYLRCREGKVTWAYPRGALRVVLRLGATNREFRGCLRLRTALGRSSDPRSRTPVPDMIGWRGYVETAGRGLVPLEVNPLAPSCFLSRGGRAAVYLEADASQPGDVTRRVALLEYDLQPLPRDRAYDPAEECRPCTREELAHAYCTADAVARGVITSAENDPDFDSRNGSPINGATTRLLIRVSRHLRRATSVDSLDTERGIDDDEEAPWEDNSLEPRLVVHVPRHCHAKRGSGEFVFMARKKLGELALTCAPRLEDWALLVGELNRDGSAHCILKS